MEKESCFKELTNSQLELAYDLIENTGVNLFLTGKAGTGKTTFLRKLQRQSYKRMVVVAPTGVAAINAGGVTIHSFFQLDLGPFIPDPGIQRKEEPYKFNKDKINIIKSLDLLVIDEISMVRADLLDAVDHALKRIRKSRLPFGGVQLLMIGDIQQLPPVVRDEDIRVLSPYYASLFFFHSIALKQTNYACIELKHIFRQSDQIFINILNKIRENNIDDETLQILNKRVCPDFRPQSEENYIILTTHNNQARNINDKRLSDLKGKKHIYEATISGNFPKMAFPTEETLELKEGAQVMFIKNDPSAEKRFYNGKIGVVHRLDGEKIEVKLDDIEQPITVEPMEWENKKYSIDKTTKEIKEEVEGVFLQYPLRLAWAITIHKSQGLTFDKVIVDAGMAFTHGQVYVALSRCKTLDGLVLSSQIDSSSLFSNHEILQFNKTAESKTPCLEDDERIKVLQTAKEHSAGLPILVGGGTNSLKHTVRSMQMLDPYGVDAFLIVVPYYNKPTQEGQYQYFKAVAESTDKPIVLYNVPGRTGANMSAETTLRLAEIENIVAIKEASGNRGQIEEILRNAPKDFMVLSGNDDDTIWMMQKGGAGVISVASNVAPVPVAKLAHAMLEGKVEKAAGLHEKLSPLFRNCFVESNPIPAKAALAAMGMMENELRLPLVPAQQKTYDLMVETVKNLGLL